MELLYVWVEEYRNIKRQGFNFSPNYDFEVIENNGEYTLVDNYEEAKKKGEFKEQPEKFFGENISNITAIVGKNGSGKSTLLNFITEERLPKIEKYILTGNKLITPKYNSLFIYKNEKEILYRISRKSSEFNIKVDGAENMEDKEVNKNEKMPYAIYFDNIFNPFKTYHGDKTHGKIFDISTSYEFFHNNFGEIGEFCTNEVILSLLYMCSDKFDEKTLKKPNLVRLTNLSDRIYGKCQTKNLKNDFIVNLIYIYLREYMVIKRGDRIEIEGTIKETIKDIMALDIKKHLEWKTIEAIKDKIEKQIEKEIESGNVWEITFSNEEYEKTGKQRYEKYIEIIIKFDELIKMNEIVDEKLEIKFEKISKLIDFLKMIKDSGIKDNHMEYSYDVQYSSGERALLTLYSRLISLLEKTKEDIILLLDEPEVFAHPEWQREFIFYLTNFIKLVYKDKKVQIILTSHSPFVASDLPRENVIMLDVYDEKDEEVINGKQNIGNCKVVKNINLKTFGANIFDLYTEAFFVESSFGEFAKGKIKEVVNDLTPNQKGEYCDLTKERIKEIEYIIGSIGERLVSTKLEKLYEDYRNNKNSIDYKKEQLKILQQKLRISNEQMINMIKNGDLDD